MALPGQTILHPPAILRETSGETRYLMARLVFRHYTHLPRTICTSITFRPSTRVSPGFGLDRCRSPSFGYQRSVSDVTLASQSFPRSDESDPGQVYLPLLRLIGFVNPIDSTEYWTPRSVFQDGRYLTLKACRSEVPFPILNYGAVHKPKVQPVQVQSLANRYSRRSVIRHIASG